MIAELTTCEAHTGTPKKDAVRITTAELIALTLVIGGVLPTFQVPMWVVVVSAAGIAIGTGFGGLALDPYTGWQVL